ncbi:MAG: CvpA family protein [Zoogloeaceae bacterium]|nr:CvpA family protein [Zoogloeaceae bacterium]
MTVFDYTFLGLLAIMTVLGLWRGLVSEVLALVAWILAIFLARTFAQDVGQWLGGLVADPAARQVAGFVLIVIAVLLLIGVVRFLLRELLKVAGLGLSDRFLGGCFGLLKGLLIAMMLVTVGGMIGFARAPWWQGAYFAPPLETAVLASRPWLPDVIAKRIRFR